MIKLDESSIGNSVTNGSYTMTESAKSAGPKRTQAAEFHDVKSHNDILDAMDDTGRSQSQ